MSNIVSLPPHGHRRTIPSHNATEFIPYNAPHIDRPRNMGSLLDSHQVNHARKMAVDVAITEAVRKAIEKERWQLHLQSQERARNWGNTVMGQRNRRLAAKEERAAQLELERQKIDVEWDMVRKKERQDAIDRARWMQKVEQPRIRALHSSLLLSNVIEERNKQLEASRSYKARALAARRAEDQRILDAEKEEIRKDHEKVIRSKIAALQNGEDQRQQVLDHTERQRLAELENGDAVWGVKAREAAKAEFLDQQAVKAKRLAKEIEIREALHAAHNAKLERKVKEREEAIAAHDSVVRFEDMKKLFSSQRKQAEHKIVSDRQTRTEAAMGMTKEGLIKTAQTRAEFLKRNEHAHDGQYEQRMAKEETARKKRIDAQRKYQQEHYTEKASRNETEHAADLALRHQFEEEAREFWEKENGAKSLARLNMDKLKEDHRKEINRKSLLREAVHKEDLQAHKLILSQALAADMDFETYALKLLDEWKAAGKETKPILRILHQEQALRKREVLLPPGQNLVNTFSRLGFPGRSMKELEDEK
ncbi:hypothetical protein DFS34DRAFT_657933 [Phlyctochytrium arcticum]|nr:hypothetical protein DFS34DRAFT_657933 [Phlyctochytrium arcticum]